MRMRCLRTLVEEHMKLDTRSTRSRSSRTLLLLLAAVSATTLGCRENPQDGGHDTLYAHGRIHVDEKTKLRWDASERDVEAAGKKIQPIQSSDTSSVIPVAELSPATLRALMPSERHGAGDKRLLSVLDTTRGRRVVTSSGIIAEVTLVKGSEYKDDKDFRTGWLPLAIVVLPPRGKDDAVVYPKLHLHGDTSWVFARERSNATWVGSIVRITDGKVVADPVEISASTDSLEPVVGARFAWEDDDESIWATCAGNCCKVIAHRSL
jgi:hypothetical protein